MESGATLESVRIYSIIMKLNSNKNYVSASTMKERVVMLAPSIAAPDEEAESETTYTTQNIVWGDWRPGASTRTLQEMALNYNNVGRLLINYGVEINSFYKIQINGVNYTIHSLTNYQNANQFYDILLYTNDQ